MFTINCKLPNLFVWLEDRVELMCVKLTHAVVPCGQSPTVHYALHHCREVVKMANMLGCQTHQIGACGVL